MGILNSLNKRLFRTLPLHNRATALGWHVPSVFIPKELVGLSLISWKLRNVKIYIYIMRERERERAEKMQIIIIKEKEKAGRDGEAQKGGTHLILIRWLYL